MKISLFPLGRALGQFVSTFFCPLFLLFSGRSLVQEVALPSVIFAAENLQDDFAHLRKHIETKNPIAYLYRSKEEVTSFLDSIERLIDRPMTELEFYRLISPIASLIKDGHNLILPSERVNAYLDQSPHHLPVEIALLDGQLFIKEHYSPSKDLQAGQELDAINGVQAKVILDRLYEVLPREGHQVSLPTNYLNKWFRYFYHMHFGFEKVYHLLHTDLKGQQKETVVAGMSLDDIIEKRKEYHPTSSKPKGISVDIIDKDAKVARLNLPTFAKSFLKSRYGQKKFRKEMDRCFAILFQEEIAHLVIDLRDNSGGNPAYSVYVLKYLFDRPFTQAMMGRVVTKPEKEGVMERTSKRWFPWYGIGRFRPKKKQYLGELYVLINGGTFSAAVEFASTLQRYERAVFIGEETGGNPVVMTGNYWKEGRKLPHTKIAHYSGYICTLYDDLGQNKGRGIIPDHPVQKGRDDLLSGKDLEMEKALSIIAKQVGRSSLTH
ncbi:MAG: S41 family peptidase [Bacteroidota bacterium]